MGPKRYKPEEIVARLRESEVLLAAGISLSMRVILWLAIRLRTSVSQV